MVFIPIIKTLGLRKNLLLSPLFFSAFFSTSVSAQFLCRETKSGVECFSTSVSSQLFICRETKSGEKIYRDGPCNAKTEHTLSGPKPSTVEQVSNETQRLPPTPEQTATGALVALVTNPGHGLKARRKAAALLLRHLKRPITETTSLTASNSEKLAIDFLVSIASDPNGTAKAQGEAAAILLGVDNPTPPANQKKPITFTNIGNMSLGSDGTLVQHFGGISTSSDGTVYTHSGNTSFGSNGVIYNRSGSTTFGSNGTVCNNFGTYSTCQ